MILDFQKCRCDLNNDFPLLSSLSLVVQSNSLKVLLLFFLVWTDKIYNCLVFHYRYMESLELVFSFGKSNLVPVFYSREGNKTLVKRLEQEPK